VGRLTGGNISAVAIGIADNNILQVDHASPADNDFAKFTANGIEGRSYAETLADLSGQATGAFSWNSQNLSAVGTIGCGTITSTGNLVIADAGTIGSASDTDAISISAGGVVTLTVQNITDNVVLTVDDADAADNDYAKFTANGLEGRSYAEVRSDINVADGADVTGDNAPQAHAASHAVSGADTVFPADPGADRYLMWDDVPGELVWAEVSGVSNPLNVGTDDDDPGVINVYGGGSGEAGGSILLYMEADQDAIVANSWTIGIAAATDDLIIGLTGVDVDVIKITAQKSLQVTAGHIYAQGGNVYAGVDDSQEGKVYIYGSSATGGAIYIYCDSDVDGAVDYYQLTVTQDDLHIGPANYASVIQFVGAAVGHDISELVINNTGNDMDFRVEGTGQANALFVQGSDGYVGVHDGGPAYPFTVEGDVGFLNGGTVMARFDVSAGQLYLGSNDAAEGHLILYGDAVAVGGKVQFHTAADSDTNCDAFTFAASGETFIAGPSGATDLMKWTVTAVAHEAGNDVDFIWESSGVAAALSITGSDGTISMGGALTIPGTVKADGYLYSGAVAPTNTTRLNYDGYFYATRVYNAVYNDYADFQDSNDVMIPGLCYRQTSMGLVICDERCQKGVMGIASDTFGHAVGSKEGYQQVPISVSGWVLAYVDKEYEAGTPLTNSDAGYLTRMTMTEKLMYPERLLATYDRKEHADVWGHNGEVEVNDRHWVKVK
jgi:hypothetical protein